MTRRRREPGSRHGEGRRSRNKGPAKKPDVRGAGQVYGVQPVLEALRSGRVRHVALSRAAGAATEKVRLAAAEAGVPLAEVSKDELESRTGSDRHQGVVAQLDVDDVATVDVADLLFRAEAQGEDPLVVLLDGIEDPMNLGAIIRSAFAMGAHGVVIPKNRAAQITPTVVRASAGAALHLPVAQVVNVKHAVDELEAHDVFCAAAAAGGEAADAVDLGGPLGLVVGGEARGVRPNLAQRCDAVVSIPQIEAFDSLNASVAAGILLYEATRQRRNRG
jgi:23S rRNA (guanosine2251-2'-O)-methyltransferase